MKVENQTEYISYMYSEVLSMFRNAHKWGILNYILMNIKKFIGFVQSKYGRHLGCFQADVICFEIVCLS